MKDSQRKAIFAKKQWQVDKTFTNILHEHKSDFNQHSRESAEKLDRILNTTNMYDKDGKTLSPFWIMNNQELSFTDGTRTVNGTKVLSLGESYRKKSPNSVPVNEFRKLSIAEQVEIVKKDAPYEKKFWKTWKLVRNEQ